MAVLQINVLLVHGRHEDIQALAADFLPLHGGRQGLCAKMKRLGIE